MKVEKVSKPALHADTYSVACVVNNNAEVLEGALNRIKELEKRLAQEDAAKKPLGIEEFIKSNGMTREQAINLLDNLIGMVEDNQNSDYDTALQMAKKAVEQESFKDAYIKQVVKERDIAIGQLNELGYSLGEKIRPCEKTVSVQDCINAIENTDCELSPQAWKEITTSIASLPSVVPKQDPILSEARAEIEAQGKWLAEAGYNAYNVGIAFESIKCALRK